MTKTICDGCHKEFTKRDDYVNGTINISCTEYHGDDGSERVNKTQNLCLSCLQKAVSLLGKVIKL